LKTLSKLEKSIKNIWWKIQVSTTFYFGLKRIRYRDFLFFSNIFAIRIRKTDLNLSSSLLEIDFPPFLIFNFNFSKNWNTIVFKYSFNKTFLGIWGIISKMWKSRFDDKFKSVFRFLIASFATSKILCHAYVRQKQKITVSNPLITKNKIDLGQNRFCVKILVFP